jgi:hypothetical protein
MLAVIMPSILLGALCPGDPPENGSAEGASHENHPVIPAAETDSHTLADSTLASGRTWIEMRNVKLRVDENAVLHVHRLRGEVLRLNPNPIFLDDTESFAIRIVSGTVALGSEDLTTLLNKFVFAYPGAPLKKLKIRTKGTQIVQTGIMHKGVDIPFEMTAALSIAPDGRVRMRPTSTEILGIDGMKFLSAIGLKLEKLIDLSQSPGAEVQGDDIYLDATKITPPPRIIGRLASIRVEGGALIQEFETLPEDSIFTNHIRPDSTIPNFIYFRGGQVKFGKLLMADADLLIADQNPEDPFDLYLARYTDQLVKGTSRTLPNLGLVAILPDYKKTR